MSFAHHNRLKIRRVKDGLKAPKRARIKRARAALGIKEVAAVVREVHGERHKRIREVKALCRAGKATITETQSLLDSYLWSDLLEVGGRIEMETYSVGRTRQDLAEWLACMRTAATQTSL